MKKADKIVETEIRNAVIDRTGTGLVDMEIKPITGWFKDYEIDDDECDSRVYQVVEKYVQHGVKKERKYHIEMSYGDCYCYIGISPEYHKTNDIYIEIC